MAFPFTYIPALRHRLMLAISGTTIVSAIALGCSSASSPEAACNRKPERTCYSRQQLESLAEGSTCSGTRLAPSRKSGQLDGKFDLNGCLEPDAICDGCCNPPLGPGEPDGKGNCCYEFCTEVCCGRPFVVGGQPRIAALEARGDWLQPLDSAARRPLSRRIAAEWLEDARMEHASIASFARFTLDLLAFGAPSALVEAAQRAALEEIEHAKLCFGLAARYGAGEWGPGVLPAAGARAAATLWDACLAAFDEGCVGETIAALQARAACDLARDPEARRVLAQIAAQEAQHAELAWRFVSWAAARLGPELPRTLRRKLSSLPAEARGPEVETKADVAALHAAGRLTAADRQCILRAGLRDVVAPCLVALIAARAS